MWRPRVGRLAVSVVLVICILHSFSVNAQEGEEVNGLFPVVFNLATRARITANATCGETQPEVFCKLVEHVRIFPAENRHCDICDARSNMFQQRHPVTNAIDGSQRWWQSPTLANGAGYNYVTITLDLGQLYQIAYVIVKAANAPRPGNWILERSLDGNNYRPWQYFAMTDKECEDVYRIRATVGVPTFIRDDEVICTSRYSALNPLEDGEIFVSLVNGRPGAFQPSKVLLDFTSARYIRLRFQKIRTLNADLMTFRSIDPLEVDASVTRRYYYSVKDISIGGQCICYGHASYCRRHETLEDRLQCQCMHNTWGDNCEKCLPLFNQKPWQVGGIQNLGCEECNCHDKSDECVYNATVDALRMSLNKFGMYDGGGVCLNCKEFTMGINCERCLPGYYRPQGMTPSMRYSCRACNCQETQTSTGICVPDDTRVNEGLNPGDCVCKEGFGGPSCTSCKSGYFGFPNCQLCRCNPAGSTDPNACDRACVCKANVHGSRCDQCKQGFFNLDSNDPEGCTKCFCFGVTSMCESVEWGLSKIDSLEGWVLSTLQSGGLTLLPRRFNGWLEAKTYLLKMDPRSYSQEDIHYWLAPGAYLGNRLSSYGGYLQFTIKYTLDDQMTNRYHLSEPNLILEGSDISITSDRQNLREVMENVIRIRLHEDSWFHLQNRRPVTRDEIMTVLYSLHRLLIRATYHTAQDTVLLKDVFLDTATPLVMDGSSLPTVEKCRCPEGYAGLSCESCSPGWRRVNDRLYRGVCQKCECYSHASECDPTSGKCVDCRHSTTGDNCEICLPGFYGDPRRGTPNDCRPCACPLARGNNFFAERCVARPTAHDRDAYECINCREGYTGRRCEMCSPGYYGRPSTPGGSCRRCNCGSNIDVSQPGVCDSVTGVCSVCDSNTEGEYCEKCRSGYYGSAVNRDCRPCDCYEAGSNSQQCHPENGQCSCRMRYTGLKCDRCQPGYGNIGRGCERCSCNRTGSESTDCDTVSGQCRCRPGVGGLSCDRCENGYYDFTRSGCKRCSCYSYGTSNDIDCDSQSGRCLCRPGVVGQRCDMCQSNHYGLESGQGCSPCDCNRTGSTGPLCNVRTGHCKCLPGVTGRTCDQCQPGYYGLSTTGCKICEPCEKRGHICDPDTGKCVCPPNTEGPNCEFCITNGWGHGDNGCKQNVEGQKCDKCRPGTFSLDKYNPKGCTECYCFLRSQTCQQAPYVWTSIELPHQTTSFVRNQQEGQPLLTKYGHLVISGANTFVPDDLVDRPLYWQLFSDKLPQDMVLSYNGKLEFVNYFEGPTYLPNVLMTEAPLVIIVGNGIEIQSEVSSLEPNHPAPFEVHLHEDLWRIAGHNTPISRAALMLVLQKVEAILIRAVQDGRATFAELGPVIIQRAVPAGPNVTAADYALGIELCQCPDRYTGESCQNPAPGYYRVIPPISGINVDDPDSIIGHVRPCHCHGHSQFCHLETGRCLSCQHNTAGDLCEKCADGFYGIATRGTPSDCLPCSCPLPVPTNNFSPSCIGDRNGMICTACLEGYSGLRCESCAPGFYGNPQRIGDTCKPCNCNPEGSRSQFCDVQTGHCHCIDGISGRTCEACTDPNYGLENGVCVSCYAGCTGILLGDIATISVLINNVNISGATYPWEKLHKVEMQANELRIKLDGIKSAGIKDFVKMQTEVQRYNELANNLANRLNTTGTEARKIRESSAEILNNATELEAMIGDTFDDIKKLVEGLDELVERLLYNQSGVNMTAALINAKRILDEILSRNFSPADNAARRENTLAEQLSERIRNIADANVNVTGVSDKLSEVNRRLQDLINHTRQAGDTANEALDKIEKLKDLLARLIHIRNEIKRLHDETNDILSEAEDLLIETDDDFSVTSGQSEMLDTALKELARKVNSLRSGLPRLRQLSDLAIQHALDLKDQAEKLDGLFAKTRNLSGNAVKAANAYKSIIEAINEAKKSANEALAAANASAEIAKVKDLKDEVAKLIKKSEQQNKEAMDLLKHAQDLAQNLSRVENELDDAARRNQQNRDILNEIKSKLQLLPSDFKYRLAEIDRKNRDTEKKIQDALKLLENVNANQMESKINEIKSFDADAFNYDVASDITRTKNAADEIRKMLDLEMKVQDKAQDLNRRALDISAMLDSLKAKINDARSRVNDMKMSLHADGMCHRSYRSTLKPSSTNEIRFSFKLNGTATDMLIVLLQQSPQEFLAVEIRDQKVRLSWNSGKGTGSVSHNQPLKAEAWFQVLAKRIGSVGQLKVWDLEERSEQSAQQEVSSTGAGCSLMNLNENSTVFLAGSNDLYQIPTGITRQNFTGCLGDVFIDGIRLGVYNFKTNIEEHCGACKEVPQLSLSASKVYVFNGRGFAQFKVSPTYNSMGTRVELEFKTFWEDARLFFIGNPSIGDYLAIDLKGGRIFTQFYMGGNSLASSQTANFYNTNQWTKVLLHRRNVNALLRVASEEIKFSAPGTFGSLEVSNGSIYYGGLPTLFRKEKFKDLNDSEFYYGCMRNLQIETLPPEDDTSILVNVQTSSSCRENGIHTVDFKGDGYLILRSQHLDFVDDKNDISLTFITEKEDAILFIARDVGAENYYSLSLVNGQLEVIIMARGTQRSVIKSDRRFSDRKMHCASLIKDGRQVKLVVDDVELGSTEIENVDFNKTGDLYLGGSPVAIDDIAATSKNMDGCISDVIANGMLLSMSDARQYKRADVGRCRLTTDLTSPVVAPRSAEESLVTTLLPAVDTPSADDPKSCSSEKLLEIETDAKSVANTDTFFADITKLRKDDIARSFNFSFDFRTFYPDGLFGYLVNKDKSYYFGVQLRDTKLEVAYIYDEVLIRLPFPAALNDGKWHSVHLEKVSTVLSVSYDKQPVRSDDIDEVLDIDLPLHLGGPQRPEDFKDYGISLVPHSIRGCIRSLRVNGRNINITDTHVIQDVGGCYKNVEPGAFFDGEAWGAYTTDFVLESRYTISMEFRTTSQSGILVSAGSRQHYGFTLELHEGKVKLGLKNSDGEFRSETSNDNRYLFCDNKWHEVRASLFDGHLSVAVDGGSQGTAIVAGKFTRLNTESPLFIGGLLDEFTQGASLSKDMFYGCIRNLSLNGEPVDWYALHNMKGIRKTACPIS